LKKKFTFSLFRKNEIEFIENKDVWITSSIPLIVFIFIGYIISILYGDILKIFFKIMSKNLYMINFYEKLNNWTHPLW
jgi:hypothetical protein